MKTLKILILIISTALLTLTVNAQVESYSIKAGQYAIFNVGAGDTLTVDRRYTSPATIAYRNRVDVVDTIFKVPATAPNDTISTLMAARPVGKIAAILLERGSERDTTIIVSGDSLVIGVYDTGADAIVFGYLNPFNYSVTVRDLTITNTMTAMLIEEETFYMITEEDYIMVEDY